MSDLDTIYKLRTSLEAGFKTALEASGYPVVTRAETAVEFQNRRPRYEIKARMGSATGHRYVCPDGYARYDAFRFSLAVQVVTNAAAENTVDELTAKAASILDKLHATVAEDSTNWPNCYLAIPLRNNRIESTLKTEDGIEYSTTEFQGIAQVRRSAWPNA